MTLIDHSRFRGPARVRADGNDPVALVGQIQRAFNEFRTQNDARLAALEAGRSDVVDDERINRIDGDITELTNTLNAWREEQAAAQAMGGNGRNVLSPEARQHTDAFNQWFLRGGEAVENTLRQIGVNNAASTGSDPDGGFLVPEQVDATISRVLGTVSAMRGLARIITLTAGDTLKLLVGQGGANAGWVSERTARGETNTPNLSEIAISSGEIYANVGATQRVLDDAQFDIAQWLADESNIAFSEAEGAAFINGDGINKPKGFLDYSKVANSSYAWGKIGFIASGNAGAVTGDGLIDFYHGLKAGYRTGAAFIMSDATVAAVRKLKDGQGNYLWQPSVVVDQPATLLGKPVVTDDNMPSIAANAFPIAFGNWQRGYAILDRFGTRILRDPFTNKPFVMYYITKRVGGAVTNYEAIKLLKISA